VRLEGLNFEPQAFLMTLNSSREFIQTLADMERSPAPPSLKFHLRVKDVALNQQLQDAFLSHLRYLVDEWIATGRDNFGQGEEPGKRKLAPGTGLKRILSKWAAGNKPDIRFDASGELVVEMPVHKRNFTGEGIPLTPEEAAKQEAVRWFGGFLDSQYRYRLCKCRSCHVHYYTERQPKGRIEYGTYCARHRHTASAMRSYEANNGPAQKRRLEVAAQWWGRWPKKLEGNEDQQRVWIARKVNENVSPKWTRISRNWVTLHREEIERLSRELQAISGKQTQKGKTHAEG
jgi:hypothetical protein